MTEFDHTPKDAPYDYAEEVADNFPPPQAAAAEPKRPETRDTQEADASEQDDETLRNLGRTAVRKPLPPEDTRTREATDQDVEARFVPEPFDDSLAKERRINLLAGDNAGRDAATYQIVCSKLEDMSTKGKTGLIIAADFEPQPNSSHLLKTVERSSIQPVSTLTTDRNGVFSTLTAEQIAEALGTAAAAGDPRTGPAAGDSRTATAYSSVLTRVVTALERSTFDEAGNPAKPTLVDVRDAIRLQRGGLPAPEQTSGLDLFGDIPMDSLIGEVNLTSKQQTAVNDSITPQMKQQVGPLLESLGTWLDKAIPDPDPKQILPVAHMDPNMKLANQHLVGCNTLLQFNVTPTAYGKQLVGESGLLAAGLLPFLAQQNPFEQPEMVILSNVDKTDHTTVLEIIDLCEKRGIQLLVTVGNVNERTVPLIQRGAYGVLDNDSVQAPVISRVLGTTMRKDVTSISAGLSGNQGTGDNESTSESVRNLMIITDSKSTSDGSSTSEGMGFSLGKNIAIGEGPRARPAELGNINRGEIAVIDSYGDGQGLHGIVQREYRGEFPPPPDESVEDAIGEILAKLNEIKASQAATFPSPSAPALPGSSETPNPPSDRDIVPRPRRASGSPTSNLPPMTETQAYQHYRMAYSLEQHRSPGSHRNPSGRFRDWAVVLAQYARDGEVEGTGLTWEEYRRPYGY
ncbi:MAG TPA: hypothetical protein VLF40_03975 [Candidatus Saccharimonadales bacterium]|nr:hypothetical protein [Candidatus Saccharimonadales bacterium]